MCMPVYKFSMKKSDLHNRKIAFLFPNHSTKTYVVGTQKNRLNGTGFFEQPKHMLKIMGKNILKILR